MEHLGLGSLTTEVTMRGFNSYVLTNNNLSALCGCLCTT